MLVLVETSNQNQRSRLLFFFGVPPRASPATAHPVSIEIVDFWLLKFLIAIFNFVIVASLLFVELCL